MISKKDLLSQTGISYGQLYRWKREGLIPSDWFIKQSSFTGQETFFPKEKVLKRVEAILTLKDTHSLEDLAKLFSPGVSERFFTLDDLSLVDELSEKIVSVVTDTLKRQTLTYIELILLVALSRFIGKHKISDNELNLMTVALIESFYGLKSTEYLLYLLKLQDNYYLAVLQDRFDNTTSECITTVLNLDNRIKIVDQLALNDISSEFTVKYKDSFNSD